MYDSPEPNSRPIARKADRRMTLQPRLGISNQRQSSIPAEVGLVVCEQEVAAIIYEEDFLGQQGVPLASLRPDAALTELIGMHQGFVGLLAQLVGREIGRIRERLNSLGHVKRPFGLMPTSGPRGAAILRPYFSRAEGLMGMPLAPSMCQTNFCVFMSMFACVLIA